MKHILIVLCLLSVFGSASALFANNETGEPANDRDVVVLQVKSWSYIPPNAMVVVDDRKRPGDRSFLVNEKPYEVRLLPTLAADCGGGLDVPPYKNSQRLNKERDGIPLPCYAIPTISYVDNALSRYFQSAPDGWSVGVKENVERVVDDRQQALMDRVQTLKQRLVLSISD